jgi:thiol:disulfide interchange protein
MEPNAIVETVKGVITELTTLLGPTAEMAWQVAMQHNYAVAVMSAVYVLIGLFMAVGGYKLSVYTAIRAGKEVDNAEAQVGWAMVAIFSGLASVAGVALAMSYLYWAVMRFMCPAWMTIQDILSMAK